MIDIEKIREALENLKGIDIFIDGSIWSYTDTDYEDDIKLIEKALTELGRLQQNQLTLNRYLELEAKGINISKIDWDEKKKMLHILQMNKEMLGSEVK